MNFELSEEQKLLKQTVADFVKKDSPVERFRELREDPQGYSTETWKQMAELGWLALWFPESAGGFGFSFVAVSLLLEQFGRTLVPEPYIPSVVLAGTALSLAGEPGQIERWLQPMIDGQTTLALGYVEQGTRHDARSINTRAETTADGYLLNGEKRWVLNGHAADHLVISASTVEGPSLFVLDRETEGLTITPVQMIDYRRAAMVKLDGVKVSADRLLGPAGSAGPVLERVMDYAATAACAEGVGLMDTVLQITLEYLKTRTQFGRKIGAFQALQHRAVDMFVECQLTRSAMIRAAIRADDPDRNLRETAVSAAKLQLNSGMKYVTRQAIQLHGGIGITDEADVGLYFKRAHALNTLFGDEEYHLDRFGQLPGFLTGV